MRSSFSFYGLGVFFWFIAFVAVPLAIAPAETARVLVFVATVCGMICFFIAMGYSVADDAWGIFLSGRNAYSLSRLQMVLWTLVVLSALIAVAVSRAWAIGGVGSATTTLSIGIPGDLLAAMGISYFTGFAAPAALVVKARSASTLGQRNLAANRLGEPILANGSVVQRPLSAAAKFVDIIQGDDLATAGTVDLSKVQQLLITLLLVGAYFVILLGLFHGGAFSTIDDNGNELTQLPDFSPNLVSLMGLSHAGYLAYKMAPRSEGEASPHMPALRPSPPDRLAP